MTKQEVVKILAMLGAFYGRPKSEATLTADAWNAVLGDYPFEAAYSAVLDFVKHDTRDYATFPAPGVIIKIIKKEQDIRMALRKNAVKNISKGIGKGKTYDELPEQSQMLVSREKYEYWLCNPMEYISNQASIEEYLMDESLKLLEWISNNPLIMVGEKK